jgi:hypothetical protein
LQINLSEDDALASRILRKKYLFQLRQ